MQKGHQKHNVTMCNKNTFKNKQKKKLQPFAVHNSLITYKVTL